MEVKTVAFSLFLAAGLHQGRAEWRQLDARIAAFDAEFALTGEQIPRPTRVKPMPLHTATSSMRSTQVASLASCAHTEPQSGGASSLSLTRFEFGDGSEFAAAPP
jgi:hypothetical protein